MACFHHTVEQEVNSEKETELDSEREPEPGVEK